MKHRVTAIIYDKRGRVLSVGQNSYVKTHPLQAKAAQRAGFPEKLYLHAEIHAITRVKDLSRATRIFVARFGRDGKQRLAKPCAVCQRAIEEAGIKNVEYTV
jgi:deoxycytidylate deaminase